MSDPKSRILDFALRRVLGSEEAVDQAEEIARAFERGEHGSVKFKSDTEPAPRRADAGHNGHAHRTVPGPRRSTARQSTPEPRHSAAPGGRRALLSAAAAVLLIGGAAWLVSKQLSDGAPQAVASGRFALLAGDRFETPVENGTGLELAADATFWVAPGARTDLHLESGANLRFEGDSLARLVAFDPERDAEETRGVELDYGSAIATSPPNTTWKLLASGVEIELEAGTEVEVDARYDARRPAPTGSASFAALEAELEDLTVGWVTVRVRSGAARLRAQDANRTLAAGGEAFVALGDNFEFVPAQDVTDILELLADLRSAVPYPEQALFACREALAARPALWLPLAAPLAEGLRAKDSTWRYRRDLLDLLAYDSSRTSLRIARAYWLERPQDFTDDHKIALAERGAHEFEVEAEATLTWYDRDDDETDPFPAALFLALRGNDLGVPYFQEAVGVFEQPPGPAAKFIDQLPPAFAAAVAMRSLDEPEPWARALAWTRAGVDAALAEGMFQDSVSVVVALEFMDELDPRPRTADVPRVSRLPQRLAERMAMRASEFETEQDIRDVLARLEER